MTRMISVTDRTYDRLQKIKGDKSFSELLGELADQKEQHILQFAGTLKDSKWPSDSTKWIQSMRKHGVIEDKKRWKRLEKHWKG